MEDNKEEIKTKKEGADIKKLQRDLEDNKEWVETDSKDPKYNYERADLLSNIGLALGKEEPYTDPIDGQTNSYYEHALKYYDIANQLKIKAGEKEDAYYLIKRSEVHTALCDTDSALRDIKLAIDISGGTDNLDKSTVGMYMANTISAILKSKQMQLRINNLGEDVNPELKRILSEFLKAHDRLVIQVGANSEKLTIHDYKFEEHEKKFGYIIDRLKKGEHDTSEIRQELLFIKNSLDNLREIAQSLQKKIDNKAVFTDDKLKQADEAIKDLYNLVATHSKELSKDPTIQTILKDLGGLLKQKEVDQNKLLYLLKSINVIKKDLTDTKEELKSVHETVKIVGLEDEAEVIQHLEGYKDRPFIYEYCNNFIRTLELCFEAFSLVRSGVIEIKYNSRIVCRKEISYSTFVKLTVNRLCYCSLIYCDRYNYGYCL